jgi:hypothetical protein
MNLTFSGRVRSEGAVSVVEVVVEFVVVVGDALLAVDVLRVESEENPSCLGTT